MIPAEAVEAAKKAYLREFPHDENAGYIAWLIPDAAAPHMQGRSFEEVNGLGYADPRAHARTDRPTK